MHRELFRMINNQCKWMKPVCVQSIFSTDTQARKFTLENFDECKCAIRYCIDDTNKMDVLRTYTKNLKHRSLNLQHFLVLIQFCDSDVSLLYLFNQLYDKIKLCLFSKNIQISEMALEIVYNWTMKGLLDDDKAQEVVHSLLFRSDGSNYDDNRYLEYEIKILEKVLEDNKRLTPILYKHIQEIINVLSISKGQTSDDIQDNCKHI